ncbi:MAG: glycosyltransferase, partial [Candidatus Aenigmarchaeota archaeon]|nr:glycosyltransferase [Candidatus Aenigmarchaeota archaeon]
MKIVYFTETYHPQKDGVVKVIDLYKKELEKRGHKVYIFAPGPGRKEKDVFRFRSIVFKPYPEYRIALPKARLIKKIIEIKPDIIHLHGPMTAGLMGLSVAKILGIPVIVTYHTHLTEYTDFLTKRAKKVGKAITIKYIKWFHNRADVIISPSKPIAKELKQYGIIKPIKIIPTGLDIKPRNKIRKLNKTPMILHVGRLCKEKSIDVIIKEFKKIKNGKLIILSKGPDEKRLKDLVKKLHLEKKVKFTGRVSDKKRDKYYKTCDVFVSASSTETQGMVVLEAMAYGCPVIARHARGFKDIIKNGYNGLLFKKDSELHTKIEKLLLNNKLRKKLIKNGYKTT